MGNIANAFDYQPVAASQTDKVLGTNGAAMDYLSHIVIQPATTAAGTVTVKDNATPIYSFTTGTLGDLRPITVPFHTRSRNGPFRITTGANVAVLVFGSFS